jgi:hypothetical protein
MPVKVLDFTMLYVGWLKLFVHPEVALNNIASAQVAQLRAHERLPLTRLHMKELKYHPNIAIVFDRQTGLEIARRYHRNQPSVRSVG